MYRFSIKFFIFVNILDLSSGKSTSVPLKPKPVPQTQAIETKGPTKSGITTTGYSHEENSKLANNDWMSNVADSKHLTLLSLPGTHESMAIYGGDIPQCQSLSLEIQLKAGIRALDIRCRHRDNRFRIQHEYIDQKADFNQVLKVLVEFLTQNPTEVLLVRVREEYKPNANNKSFEETFKEYITQDSIKPFVWEPNSLNPSLGEVRGKIVFLQDFHSRKMFGLDYNSFNIQDSYELKTIFGLYDKWEKVKKQLITADKQREDNYYVNYLSGSTAYLGQLPLIVLPYFVAGGRSDHRTNSPLLLTGRTTLVNRDVYPDFPRVYCLGSFCLIAFEGTNDLTLKYIQNERPEFVGIVMIDFPGDGLIDAIIRLNIFTNSLSDKQHNNSTEEREIQNNIQSIGEDVDQLIAQSSQAFNSNQFVNSATNEDSMSNSYPNESQSNPNSIQSSKSNPKTNLNPKQNKNKKTKENEKLEIKPIIGPNIPEDLLPTKARPIGPNKPLDSTESYEMTDNSNTDQTSDENQTQYSNDISETEKTLNLSEEQNTEYSTKTSQTSETNDNTENDLISYTNE